MSSATRECPGWGNLAGMSRVATWLLPALLALGLYAVTVPGTYTYDDVYTAKEDPRLHDPHQWSKYLREGYFPEGADNLWRPLVSLTYAAEAYTHGDRAWPFHLINVLLHAIATALVAALAARLAGSKVGLIAGLLFAAHPVHVEAVAGIVGRAEEMALIGILAALLLFIGRPMTRGRAVGIVAWFLFAALCKEQGLLIPMMLATWAALRRRWPGPYEGPLPAVVPGQDPARLQYAEPRRREPKPPMTDEQRANSLLIAILTLTLAAYVAYRNHILPWFWERGFLDPAMNPLVKSDGPDRCLLPLAILGRYAVLLVAPARLSIDYGMDVFTPKLNWHEPWLYIGVIGLVAVVAAFVALWRRRNAAAVFLLIGFGLSYFMVSNVLLIGTVMGERLMYIPSAFFCALIAMALAKVPTRPLAGLMAMLLILASVRTVSYAYQWNTRARLYRYAVDTQPKASMPYLLLAGESDAETADALMARAREVAPDAPQVWGKSAWAKVRLGQLDEAEVFAKRSFDLRRGNADAMGVFRTVAEMRKAAATRPSR